MALALTSYATTAGYVLALSHNDLLLGGSTNYVGGFVSPRVNPPGGFFGILSRESFEQSTILTRSLGTDGTTTPTLISGTTTSLRSLLRVGSVTYATMVSTSGQQCGIGVVADAGTVTNFSVATLQEVRLSATNSFNGYQPSQMVYDPATNSIYFGLGDGASQIGATPTLTQIRVMEVNLSMGQPITPTEWVNPYGLIPSSPPVAIPGFSDDRASRPTSIALSPDGLMLYVAVSERIVSGKSRILGYRRSDKAKTFDILINDSVNGILIGSGGLAGKMLIKKITGVDEYDLTTGTTQAIVTGDLDASYTYGFSAFGTNQAYFHSRPNGAGLGNVQRLTVPGLVGVDPGGSGETPGSPWTLTPATPLPPPGPTPDQPAASPWLRVCSGALPAWIIDTPGD